MDKEKITIDAEEFKTILNEVNYLSEKLSEVLQKIECLGESLSENVEANDTVYEEDDSGYFQEIRSNIDQVHEEEDFKEIFVLEESLKEAGVPYEITKINEGYMLSYPGLESPICTVLESANTIGSDMDMLEVTGLLKENELEDGKGGFLLADNVFERIMEDYESNMMIDNEDFRKEWFEQFRNEDFMDD